MVFEHEYLTCSWLDLTCSWLDLTFSLLDLNCFLLYLGCILILFHTKVAVIRALGIGKKIKVFECEYWICFWLDLTFYWLYLTCSLLDLFCFPLSLLCVLNLFHKKVPVIRVLGIDKKIIVFECEYLICTWFDLTCSWLNLTCSLLDLTCILLSL